MSIYTMAFLGGPKGTACVPSMVSTNERYLDSHDLNFSLPESYAPLLSYGMPIFFSWFPNIEFLLVDMTINNATCDLKCVSTESIFAMRPAVPEFLSTTAKADFYEEGWIFGDPDSDTADTPIKEILDEIWSKTVNNYQLANPTVKDKVANLRANFESGVTGNVNTYTADGDLMSCLVALIGKSTTRCRLASTLVDLGDGDYTMSFRTVPCKDNVKTIRVNGYRTDVENVQTSISIADKPSVIIRASEDDVYSSNIHKLARNYVTIGTVENSDEELTDLDRDISFNNQLVFEPYGTLSDSYNLQLEYHGELDISSLNPGDTVTTDSNHPRPSWVPDELMISEIVRTYDHLGYREFPTLVNVPAVYGRDNASTRAIKSTIKRIDVE